MFLATFPVYFFNRFFYGPDTHSTPAWAGCLYFLERALLQTATGLDVGRPLPWSGHAVEVHYHLTSIGLFPILVIDKESRRWPQASGTVCRLCRSLCNFFPGYSLECHTWLGVFAYQGVDDGRAHSDISTFLLPA